jgi:Icc-related predicted phosphoesterase
LETVILHLSDPHCNTRAVWRLLRVESYDLVVATGDYECVDTAQALLEARSPLAAVTGNMDNASVRRILEEAGVLIDGKVVAIKGLVFAGVGGLTPHNDIESVKGRLAGKENVIVVSHHPSKGVLDEPYPGIHAGLIELAELLKDTSIRAHLFGHIHEARGCVKRHNKTSVNPGPLMEGYYALVKINDIVDCRLLKLR